MSNHEINMKAERPSALSRFDEALAWLETLRDAEAISERTEK